MWFLVSMVLILSALARDASAQAGDVDPDQFDRGLDLYQTIAPRVTATMEMEKDRSRPASLRDHGTSLWESSNSDPQISDKTQAGMTS